MSDALAFEGVRIRTIRSTYLLIGLALALGALVALAVTAATRRDPVDDAILGIALTGGSEVSPLPFAAVLVGILGVFATGHEYRHGTIQPTLVAMPHRSTLVAAKLAVVAGAGALTAVVSVLVNWLVTVTVRGEVVGLLGVDVLLGYMVFVVLWGVLGASLALLLRNIPGALVVLLLTPLVVEPLLRALTFIPALEELRDATAYLPFSAGTALVRVVETTAGSAGSAVAGLERWEGGAVFATAIAVVLAVAWVLFERRDA